jgi:lipopolysaccharide biosynthesis regulator YciM
MADALVAQAVLERELNHASGVSVAESEAFATFDALIRDKNLPETTRKALDLIHFKYGEALMTAGLFDRAAKEFMASAQVPGAQEGLATMAHLYAARALDLSGKRNDALTQYRAVLARPNVYDAHEQAESGLKEVYKKKLT